MLLEKTPLNEKKKEKRKKLDDDVKKDIWALANKTGIMFWEHHTH